MENKIFELMLKNSKIVDLRDEGEMPVLNVEQFRDIAREVVKLFTTPVVVGTLCQCTEWEGTSEDGTCYECRKPHRDNY